MTVTETAPPPLLTLLEADKLAREVINEAGPDFRYHPHPEVGVCTYVYRDEPDCIVARILHRHGVSISTLKLWEGATASEMERGRGSRGARALLTPEASRFLDDLQCEQDSGAIWSLAHSFAVRQHLGRRLEATVTPQGGEHRDH